jgi:hypothetical protein
MNDGWADDVLTNDVNQPYDIILIGELMRKCRSIVFMIKRSTLIQSFFEKKSVQLGIRRTLSADVCTRWNSTLHMIESFIALKEVLCKLFHEKSEIDLPRKQSDKLDRLELTSSDWTLLKILSQLLKPFDLATKLLSSQQFPTIGLCIFAFHHIKMFLEDTESDDDVGKRLKRRLLTMMTRYIEDEKEQMRIIKVSFSKTE